MAVSFFCRPAMSYSWIPRIFSGVVTPRISAGVNNIQFLRRSDKSCNCSCSAGEIASLPDSGGAAAGGPSKSNGKGASELFSKSGLSKSLDESAGTLELTVSFLGEENQMGWPAWSGANCTWAKNTATNTPAAKTGGRFKWAERESILNYQANLLDTQRQK